MDKTNSVQEHISEKFHKFADRRFITMSEEPCLHNVKIFSSKPKESQHMAAAAKKGALEGFIINVGDKMLMFFEASQVRCEPVKDGEKVEGKNAIAVKNKNGVEFAAIKK